MYTHDNKQQPHRIRSIRKPEQQITAFNFSEFPKEEPGVIYVRQSSIAQVQNNIHSYEMQTDKFLEHFREKMECTNVIEIIADDEGISGTKDIHERKGLSRVMRLINGTELLKGQRIGWIGVVHINRLTRDKWLVTPGTIMKDCYENNIWIATLRMNFNFQDIYCQRVFMIEAEESARHLEWMKLVLGGGLNTASSKGYYDGRWLVPGYIVDRSNEKEKKYVIYEPHAEVVKWLFLRYLELDGNLLALCKEVEQKPFLFPAFESWVDPKNISKFGSRRKRTRSLIMEGPNKGCYRSSTWGIRSILCNPVYIGWWLPRGGGLVENNHDPIVDDVLFAYAHRRLSAHDLNGDRQKPARVNRKGEATAILKKVLHDDTDKLMYATFDRAEDKHFRYKSYASSSLTISYRYSVNARELDQAFLTKLFERLAEVKQIEDWEDKLQERQMAKAQSQEDKKSLIRKQIDRAKRQRAEIMETMNDPDIPKSKQMKIDYANQVTGLEQKIRQWEIELEAQIDDVEDEEATLYEIHSFLPNIAAKWEKLSFDVRLRFVGALVRKAVLTIPAPRWYKLEIYWKHPIGDIVDIGHFRKSHNGSSWSSEEEAIVIDMYADADAAEIMSLLPERTWSSIKHYAERKGVTRERKRKPNSLFVSKQYAKKGAPDDQKYEEENALDPNVKKAQWRQPPGCRRARSQR